jgi:hypothetical protein
MNDKPYYDQDQASMLRSWVLTQMLRGAGYAAAVVLAIGLLLWSIHLVGLLLPEESKQAPSPYSMIEVPALVAVA